MEFLEKNAAVIGIIIMPFTYAFVGWMTNVVALKMTFFPLKFRGILPPYLGWQGIVPRKSVHLALQSVQTITKNIIKVDEFFHKIDHNKLAEEIDVHLETAVDKVLPEYAEQYIDWKSLSAEKQQAARSEVFEKGKDVVLEVCRQLKEETSKVFNFKTFFVKNLTKDNSRLIVDLFIRIGNKEFKFIELCGLYFGFILGLIQVGIWELAPLWYLLPFQGVVVGYVTNWLALTMIFRPLYPKKYGPVKYQGLFLKRQTEVSAEYSKAVSEEVLDPHKILEEVLYKKIALETTKVMAGTVQSLGAENTNGGGKFVDTISDELSPAAVRMEKIMARSMNIQKTMFGRMKEMPPEEFEPLLRSAFKEDEYILILIGAVLGAIVGMGQALYMIAVG